MPRLRGSSGENSAENAVQRPSGVTNLRNGMGLPSRSTVAETRTTVPENAVKGQSGGMDMRAYRRNTNGNSRKSIYRVAARSSGARARGERGGGWVGGLDTGWRNQTQSNAQLSLTSSAAEDQSGSSWDRGRQVYSAVVASGKKSTGAGAAATRAQQSAQTRQLLGGDAREREGEWDGEGVEERERAVTGKVGSLGNVTSSDERLRKFREASKRRRSAILMARERRWRELEARPSSNASARAYASTEPVWTWGGEEPTWLSQFVPKPPPAEAANNSTQGSGSAFYESVPEVMLVKMAKWTKAVPVYVYVKDMLCICIHMYIYTHTHTHTHTHTYI